MPTDPVQVVAEARTAFRMSTSMSTMHARYVPKENAAIVAALKAAGALMPETAAVVEEKTRRAVKTLKLAVEQIAERDALLQEALSVLGHRHKAVDLGEGLVVCVRCRLNHPCPEASLAEKIEKATGGEG